jgi:uncharacterized protein YbdZ (MbtH family)
VVKNELEVAKNEKFAEWLRIAEWPRDTPYPQGWGVTCDTAMLTSLSA